VNKRYYTAGQAAAVIIAVTALLFFNSCGRMNKEINGVIEIGEKMFISRVNDVYLNAGDYLGKTIKIEGIFTKENFFTRDEPYCYVIRYGPGCCGSDGNVGFEVAWAKDTQSPYPDLNSWVEVTGVLKQYEEDEYEYLYLELSSLNTLNKRGAEYVTQ